MLSILSIKMLFRLPDGMSKTLPSGTRESLSQRFLRMLAKTLNVAMWLRLVEIMWKSAFPTQKAAIARHSLK